MNINVFHLHTKLAKIQLRKALSVASEIEMDCDLLDEVLSVLSAAEGLLDKIEVIASTPVTYSTPELEAAA